MKASNFLLKALNKGIDIIENLSREDSFVCEKGDCLINNDTLYHTCSEINCPRMKETQVVSNNGIVDPCLWKYMKQLEKIQNDKRIDPNKQADFVYDLAKEYMPRYVPFLDIIGLDFIFSGITRDNLLFSLLWELKDADISWTRHQLGQLVVGKIGNTELHLQYDFYRNLSLYNRDGLDFDYTVKIFETVMDEKKLSKFYDPNTVDINDLYTSEGNIKVAGIGGSEAGFCEDTIWNSVETWKEN